MVPGRINTTGAGGVHIELTLDDFERTDQAFRDTRTRIARRLRAIVKASAEQTVLPAARQRAAALKVAGELVSTRLVIRAGRGNSAVLTTSARGVRARAIRLLEFGGTVSTPIRPRRRRALAFGGQHPIARVTNARHYRARLFLTHAARERQDAFARAVRDGLVGEFDQAGFEVD